MTTIKPNATPAGANAEVEFEPAPDNPKGWFCRTDCASHVVVLTHWELRDSNTREAVSLKEYGDRLGDECADHLMLPNSMTISHYSPQSVRGRTLSKAAAQELVGPRRPDADAIYVDLGLVVSVADIPRIEAMLKGGARCLPRHIIFGESKIYAWRVDHTIIREPGLVYDLYGSALGWGRYFEDGETPEWARGYSDDLDSQAQVLDGESAPEFFARMATKIESLEQEISLLADCGGDAFLLRDIMASQAKQAGTPRFLVKGLVPKNCVTMLGGKRKVGKSTAALELANAVAGSETQWCGFDLKPDELDGFVLVFCGEDSQDILSERIRRMNSGRAKPLNLIVHGNETTDLKAALAQYRRLKVSLIVVDPTRKYYSGDEDGSDAPNGLFNMLEAEANAHDCAMIVTHHPRKDANPRNLTELAASLRGSAIFLDRPRVTIGLLRKGDESIIGIPTDSDGNALHNLPAEIMFAGERRLKRDDATHRLLPVEAPGEDRAAAPADRQVVLRAIEKLDRAGTVVTKSGKRGLFENWPEGFEKLSRSRVHAACDSLLASGELALTADGLTIRG